jgi:hypothetical protein
VAALALEEGKQVVAQDPELLRVLELLVQALEQVVRVSALEMEQVRAEVEALAQAVGLVPEKALEPVLAVVPDLVEVSEQAQGLVQVQLPGW